MVLIKFLSYWTDCIHIHSPKCLATLDGEIVDPEITITLKCGMYLRCTMHKPNIYTIWYIECNSICHEMRMKKYPWKRFQWYCLPGGHINWNKGQISIRLVCPQNFSSTFQVGFFVSNDNTRNEFKKNKAWCHLPTDVSDDVIPGHGKIGTCDMLSVFLCVRFILNRRLFLKP